MEEHYLGFNHAESGASLLDRWELPRELAAAVDFHHPPAFSSEHGFTALTAVHVANYLDHVLEVYSSEPSLQIDENYPDLS